MDKHVLEYNYLVIALGGNTSFFGMEDIRKHSFTMKTIDDAIILRNHVINILEQANLELENNKLKQRLLTFVVVGGGFGGVKTVGELNDFLKKTVKCFYKKIDAKEIKIILVNAHDKILPEVGEELSKFALQKLKERGVQFVMNAHAKWATDMSLSLDYGMVIPTYTLIWTGGVNPRKVVANLPCSHNKHHRIIASI
jgi:NADH:quinone reductase (non-electrogenic)